MGALWEILILTASELSQRASDTQDAVPHLERGWSYENVKPIIDHMNNISKVCPPWPIEASLCSSIHVGEFGGQRPHCNHRRQDETSRLGQRYVRSLKKISLQSPRQTEILFVLFIICIVFLNTFLYLETYRTERSLLVLYQNAFFPVIGLRCWHDRDRRIREHHYYHKVCFKQT